MDWSKMLTRGEGVKNPENLADVIYEQPLIGSIKYSYFELSKFSYICCDVLERRLPEALQSDGSILILI